MPTKTTRLITTVALLLAGTVALCADGGPGLAAFVHKPSVSVHSAPDLSSPTVATLRRDAPVHISAQQGLWFEVALPKGEPGFLRVNEVRVAYADKDNSGGVQALFSGKAGKGRVTETAGVRGLDESDLKSAAFDATQFAKLESYRLTPEAAAADARASGWMETTVAYAAEAKAVGPTAGKGATQVQKRSGIAAMRGFLGSLGAGALADSVAGVADAAAGKSEEEQSAEELALGPELAGRILGAAKLWQDDEAQRRVNRIGRWMASQTSRPQLPWVFGVIDTPEVNAFAAPGGYVLMTRGMYELLADDAEIAAVLGHEISHIVQRDHYNVIHKQQMTSATTDALANQVNTGGNLAASMAKEYVRVYGATVMLVRLDQDAEYRSDEASEFYLARSGFNPMALYAVLQKMTAFGTASSSLTQLYRTHPPLDRRLDRIDGRAYAGTDEYLLRE